MKFEIISSIFAENNDNKYIEDKPDKPAESVSIQTLIPNVSQIQETNIPETECPITSESDSVQNE